ncbi:MAG: hypothetical protein HZA50_11140 [Planctomycetes bacterium]|nr:hypothetical protein [Planctomycetota bacterium]
MNKLTIAAISLSIILGWQSPIWSNGPQPAASAPSEAVKAFSDLFGAEIRKAVGSADPKDDVQLADKLLKAAKDVTSQLELLAIICNKAYDLGLKDPSGYQIAIDAMKFLMDKAPDSKALCMRKIADAYMLRYKQARTPEDKQRFGEEAICLMIDASEAKLRANDCQGALDDAKAAASLAATIKSPSKEDADGLVAELTLRLQLERQVSQLKAKLQASASDAAARQQIVKLLLIELDDPAEAKKFLGTGIDEATSLYVPLAAKKPEELQETAVGELADWYYKLAESAASSNSKENMLGNAREYYELFLKLHKGEDLSKSRAILTIQKIDDAIAKLSVNTRQQWADLLKIADTKYSTGGQWERKDQKIVGTSDSGPGALTIPVATQDSYVLQGTFTVTKGADAHIVLPAGSSVVDLILFGWGGEICALSKINGKFGDQNETAVKTAKFELNKEYSFEARVRVVAKDANIEIALNGKPLIKWQGPTASLSVHDGINLRAEHAFAISPWDSSVTFSSLKLRMLSGTAQPVKISSAADDQSLINTSTSLPPPPPPPPRFRSGRWGRRGG